MSNPGKINGVFIGYSLNRLKVFAGIVHTFASLEERWWVPGDSNGLGCGILAPEQQGERTVPLYRGIIEVIISWLSL